MNNTIDAVNSSGCESPGGARLSLRRMRIDTYHENVAYMHKDCEIYRAEGFKALSKVEVRTNGHSVLATLNVVDNGDLLACNELGLSDAAFKQLGLEPGELVTVSQADPPESIQALHRKLAGERLELDDFRAIIHDVAEHHYSKIELTAFVVATNRDELDREEVYFLTQAMIEAGRHLDWKERVVVDKHCIGGIPGNRTSMLIVPIVAAHGMVCPKTSSRAITSPSGTADTMEVLADVELSFEKMAEIAKDLHFCKFAPTLFVSAVTRENLVKIFPQIETVVRNRARRVSLSLRPLSPARARARGAAHPVGLLRHPLQRRLDRRTARKSGSGRQGRRQHAPALGRHEAPCAGGAGAGAQAARDRAR